MIIGSDNGLVPIRRQAIIWTKCWFTVSWNHISIVFHFLLKHLSKCLSKCHLPRATMYISSHSVLLMSPMAERDYLKLLSNASQAEVWVFIVLWLCGEMVMGEYRWGDLLHDNSGETGQCFNIKTVFSGMGGRCNMVSLSPRIMINPLVLTSSEYGDSHDKDKMVLRLS